jgi:hypothetical protein
MKAHGCCDPCAKEKALETCQASAVETDLALEAVSLFRADDKYRDLKCLPYGGVPVIHGNWLEWPRLVQSRHPDVKTLDCEGEARRRASCRQASGSKKSEERKREAKSGQEQRSRWCHGYATLVHKDGV